MTSLKNSTVCITGASSGIGKACAVAFAGQGANVLLTARRHDRIKHLAQELARDHHVKAHAVALDVTNRRQVDDTFSSFPSEWKDIDILINNAGLARGLARFYEGKVEDWEEMIDTNVKGLMYVTRAVLARNGRAQQRPCHQHWLDCRAPDIPDGEHVQRKQVRSNRTEPEFEDGPARDIGTCYQC